MTYKGIVRGSVIELEGDVELPEGTRVSIIPEPLGTAWVSPPALTLHAWLAMARGLRTQLPLTSDSTDILRQLRERRASLVIKVVVREPDSEKADALFAQWSNEGTHLIAPAFFDVETDSILKQKVILRQELTPEQAKAAFTALPALPIRQLTVPAQRQRAWQIATEFGFATVYDATYLALAELQGCPFWTADKRLFDQVKARMPFVQWLGDYVPRTTIS